MILLQSFILKSQDQDNDNSAHILYALKFYFLLFVEVVEAHKQNGTLLAEGPNRYYQSSFYAFNGRTSNIDYCSAMGFVVKLSFNHDSFE